MAVSKTLAGMVQTSGRIDGIFFNSVELDATVIIELPVANAGMVAGELTVRTHNGKPYLTPLALSGPNAGQFRLDNGGVAPCNLLVGPVAVAGAFIIKIQAP